MAVQTNGGVLLGGEFERFMIRLNPDGSRDTNFDEAASIDREVLSICIQDDNKILIGGTFRHVGGFPRARVARLFADGTLDTDFDPGGGADGTIHALLYQRDQRIVLCGEFRVFNGTPTPGIVRLDSDGTEDTSFVSRPGPDAALFSGAIQKDGKILIMGPFQNVHNTPRSRICRLNMDGTVDTDFNAGGEINGSVVAAREQPDGKIVLGGTFTSIGGIPRNRVARLNPNGSLDGSFQPGPGPDNWVVDLAIQPDSKIIIAGYFVMVAGQTNRGVARLNPDGSLDATFNSGTGVGGIVLAMSLQSDGRIFITGGFGEYNGVPRLGTARLLGDLILSHPRFSNGHFEVSVNSISGKLYSLEAKNELAASNWESLPAVQGNGEWLDLRDVSSNATKRFFRVRVD